MRSRLRRKLCRLIFACFALAAARAALAAETPPDAQRDIDAVTLEGPSGLALSFSDDGRRLLSAGKTGSRVWDVETWRPIGEDFPPHENAAYLPSLGPAGRTLLASSNGQKGEPTPVRAYGEAQLWDVDAHALLQRFDHRGIGQMRAAVNSPDGTRIATAGAGRLSVWDAKSGKELFATAYPRSLRSLEFAAGGSRLLAIVTEGEWIDANGRELDQRDDLSLRGRHALVWDAASGHLLSSEEVDLFSYQEGDPEIIDCRPAAVTPDGTNLVVRETVGWATVDIVSGRRIATQHTHCNDEWAHERPFPIGGSASWIAFSNDGKRFVTVGARAKVVLWETPSLDRARTLGALKGWHAARFSADGRRILLGADDRWPLVVDAETGATLSPQPPTAGADLATLLAAMSPDGTRLAVTDGQKFFRVYRIGKPAK